MSTEANTTVDSSTTTETTEATEKVVLYVPQDVENDLANTVRRRLADEYGGFTEKTAKGGWVNPDTGELVTESVRLIETVADGGKDAKTFAKSTARWLQEKSGEHTVMWETQQVGAGFEDGTSAYQQLQDDLEALEAL